MNKEYGTNYFYPRSETYVLVLWIPLWLQTPLRTTFSKNFVISDIENTLAVLYYRMQSFVAFLAFFERTFLLLNERISSSS